MASQPKDPLNEQIAFDSTLFKYSNRSGKYLSVILGSMVFRKCSLFDRLINTSPLKQQQTLRRYQSDDQSFGMSSANITVKVLIPIKFQY